MGEVLRVLAYQEAHVDMPGAALERAPRSSLAKLGPAPLAGREQSVGFPTSSCSRSPGAAARRTASRADVGCLDERPTG